MITDAQDNAAKIAALITTVSILFAQLPTDKQEQALNLLKGLAAYDYGKLSNSSDDQDNVNYGKSISEGYEMIINSLYLYTPAKQ